MLHQEHAVSEVPSLLPKSGLPALTNFPSRRTSTFLTQFGRSLITAPGLVTRGMLIRLSISNMGCS